VAPRQTASEPNSTSFPRDFKDRGIVAGIAASAGGLEALVELLRSMPAHTGLASVVISHTSPDHQSVLSQILSGISHMPVCEAEEGVRIEPDHVYVKPADCDLILKKGVLHLLPRARAATPHRPADTFLHSLAQDCGRRAIGIVLSGAGTDGTGGLKAVKEAGGITFAQDGTALFGGMPQSAVASRCVDFVLAPERIAAELVKISRRPAPGWAGQDLVQHENQDEFHKVLELLSQSAHVDFSNYKQSILCRGIERRMVMRQASMVAEYLDDLRNDPGERQNLLEDILIPVTAFFRDPEVFEAFKDIFPRLVQNRPTGEPLRVWVPGCGSGEEVYSLAICLLEYLGARGCTVPIKIFGTDLTERAVSAARSGAYGEGIAAEVSEERLRSFFVKTANGYSICKAIRDLCVFACHDITRDPPFSRLDLISCRNVLGRLTLATQKRMTATFHHALRPLAFLALGSCEELPDSADLFELANAKHKLYVRVAGGRTPPPPPKRPQDHDRRAPVPRHATQIDRESPSALAVGGELARDQTISQLNSEREARESYLRHLLERHEAINEELRTANERINSTNEELRSANDELRTAQAELQATNDELQARISAANQLSDDLVNLVEATNIPVFVLGEDLSIRRITPAAARILNLRPADVGRPIGQLKLKVHVPDLAVLAGNVLEKLIIEEREVKDEEGCWHKLSIRPYTTPDGKVTGIVVTLIDIDTLKRTLEREVLEATALEQWRIGQELHDSTGQELIALGLLAHDLVESLEEKSSSDMLLAARVAEGIQQVVTQVRALSRGLVPVDVNASGLMAALTELARRTRALHGVTCDFDCTKPVLVEDNHLATHLYRIAKEAVANAVRHSGAKKITIDLAGDAESMTLAVRDDGVGLPPELGDNKGIGMKIMRYRAGLINADLAVGRAEPSGSMVSCTVNPRAEDTKPDEQKRSTNG
jgi:chemotaxis methyl-accepting protein methylase/signal transduction histidine kinase